MNSWQKNIYTLLKETITNTACELEYNNIFELLVAVMLSAQCTDKRVNMVTPKLFEQYPDCYAMAEADINAVESIIRPCGTYHIKANNLIEMSKALIANFNAVVPNTIEELISLPGVGRKTASVILAEGYKIPAMPVDTHVFRVSNRLGLTNSDKVDEVECELKKIFPKDKWIEVHYLILLFGRYYCKAIGYNCSECRLNKLCKFSNKNYSKKG